MQGQGPNVIASEAILTGTTRAFSPETRNKFPEAIDRIIKNTANAYRAKAELKYIFGCPPTINDVASAKLAADTVKKLWGPDAVMQFEKTTGGEDFAYYLEKAPGLIAFVGARNEEKGYKYAHHHEMFDVDEDALEMGAALYVQYALDFLNQ